jgi:hypothetical protein
MRQVTVDYVNLPTFLSKTGGYNEITLFCCVRKRLGTNQRISNFVGVLRRKRQPTFLQLVVDGTASLFHAIIRPTKEGNSWPATVTCNNILEFPGVVINHNVMIVVVHDWTGRRRIYDTNLVLAPN